MQKYNVGDKVIVRGGNLPNQLSVTVEAVVVSVREKAGLTICEVKTEQGSVGTFDENHLKLAE